MGTIPGDGLQDLHTDCGTHASSRTSYPRASHFPGLKSTGTSLKGTEPCTRPRVCCRPRKKPQLSAVGPTLRALSLLRTLTASSTLHSQPCPAGRGVQQAGGDQDPTCRADTEQPGPDFSPLKGQRGPLDTGEQRKREKVQRDKKSSSKEHEIVQKTLMNRQFYWDLYRTTSNLCMTQIMLLSVMGQKYKKTH